MRNTSLLVNMLGTTEKNEQEQIYLHEDVAFVTTRELLHC